VSVTGFPVSLFDRLAFSIPAFSVTPVSTRTNRALEVARIFTKHSKCCDKFFVLTMSLYTFISLKHAPVRVSRRRPPKKIRRWLSDEAIGAKRLRRRLERRWRFTGLEADRINYRRACRDANRLINKNAKTTSEVG